ncbi:TIR domain-containing protein [Sphingomonas sp. PP-CE-3A-406]|uniref:toll/interleukin-1 receptor domain-containing protein n=1 Tax=Sphingomonas sp. PP-CE-3A-406 TaxID=2135659 RepID=UPI000F0FF171|nr:toll/interleukin-1 receptor domain-containing protein [Sphingomonas sp. PP-CE-3A-406]RMB51734.1 TIR domain-containing protein [Sphingomonas sp. PP-CE-3A-406]
MVSKKKTIFLSHISEEGELGTIFKDRLEKDFLSLIDVFVSSDSRSIPPGDAWLKAVDDNLDRAAALIVLASPTSVARPWITFEAGAGWAKRVPTMIICHSGISPGGLPLPLGQLQAFSASDMNRISAMYAVVAQVLGSATPEPNLRSFVASIQNFERKYTEERDVLVSLRQIKEAEPYLIKQISNVQVGPPVTVSDVPESSFRKMEQALKALQNRGLLNWSYAVVGLALAVDGGNGVTGSGGGTFGNLTLTITPALAAFLKRSEFE